MSLPVPEPVGNCCCHLNRELLVTRKAARLTEISQAHVRSQTLKTVSQLTIKQRCSVEGVHYLNNIQVIYFEPGLESYLGSIQQLHIV